MTIILIQIFMDQSLVLTVSLFFSSKSESNEFVTEAAREVLCSPVEDRPVAGHVQEDCRLMQVMQNPLDLIRAEGFSGVGVSHALRYMMINNWYSSCVLLSSFTDRDYTSSMLDVSSSAVR